MVQAFFLHYFVGDCFVLGSMTTVVLWLYRMVQGWSDESIFWKLRKVLISILIDWHGQRPKKNKWFKFLRKIFRKPEKRTIKHRVVLTKDSGGKIKVIENLRCKEKLCWMILCLLLYCGCYYVTYLAISSMLLAATLCQKLRQLVMSVAQRTFWSS